MHQEDPKSVMTVKEVAEYLRISESTVYELARSGKLPCRKVGNMWRFPRESVESWLMREVDQEPLSNNDFENKDR